MTTVCGLCKLLIQKNRAGSLRGKMDVCLTTDQLTSKEYQELAGLFIPEVRQ